MSKDKFKVVIYGFNCHTQLELYADNFNLAGINAMHEALCELDFTYAFYKKHTEAIQEAHAILPNGHFLTLFIEKLS